MLVIVGVAGTLVSAGALVAALLSYRALHRQGLLTAEYRRRRGVLDAWLFATWGAVLVGSVGLLAGAAWAGAALRTGLALLVAWTLWYTAASLLSLRGLGPEVPVRWRSVVGGTLAVWALVAGVVAGALFALGRAGL